MIKIVTVLFLSFVIQISFGQADSNRTKCFGKVECNESFLASKGKWRYPVNDITPVKTALQTINNNGVSFICDTPATVYSVTDGEVISIVEYDSVFLIIIKNGSHFIAYSNLSKVLVKKKSNVKIGQGIGNMGLDLDSKYRVDMMLNKMDKEINISEWFAKALCNKVH